MSNGDWDRLLNNETGMYMLDMSRADDGEYSEDKELIFRFFSYMKDEVEYREFVLILSSWGILTDLEQVKLAIKTVGQYHASRFIMLMDYLYGRLKKGIL